MNEKTQPMIPEEALMTKIYFIRGKKVMFDRDLAELYGVETRRLKEQVRRNIERFPEDFMFELTKAELQDWVSQFATSNREKMGLRIRPFVFTEHGVLMLSGILKSDRAILVNIQVYRSSELCLGEEPCVTSRSEPPSYGEFQAFEIHQT